MNNNFKKDINGSDGNLGYNIKSLYGVTIETLVSVTNLFIKV